MKFGLCGVLALGGIALFGGGDVWAASAPAAPASSVPSSAPSSATPPASARPQGNGAAATSNAGSYVAPNYESIARLMWSLGARDSSSDRQVDDYLEITECNLYLKFYKNEFEWRKIREGTKKYLDKYKSHFSHRFEYIQPILFERYDFALTGFPLTKATQFLGSTRLQFSADTGGNTECPEVYMSKDSGYPSGAVLKLKTPFSLTFVRVPQDLAKAYLKMLEDKAISTQNGRPAYVRFRVRVDQYLSPENIEGSIYGNFSGGLERLDVFADRELLLPLYSQTFD